MIEEEKVVQKVKSVVIIFIFGILWYVFGLMSKFYLFI